MTRNTENTGGGADAATTGIPAPPDMTAPTVPLLDSTPAAPGPTVGEAAAGTASASAAPNPVPADRPRRWGAGATAAVAAGGVLALALTFGGGVALGASLRPDVPAGLAAGSDPSGPSRPSDGSGRAPGASEGEMGRPPFGDDERGGRPGSPGDRGHGGPWFADPGSGSDHGVRPHPDRDARDPGDEGQDDADADADADAEEG